LPSSPPRWTWPSEIRLQAAASPMRARWSAGVRQPARPPRLAWLLAVRHLPPAPVRLQRSWCRWWAAAQALAVFKVGGDRRHPLQDALSLPLALPRSTLGLVLPPPAGNSGAVGCGRRPFCRQSAVEWSVTAAGGRRQSRPVSARTLAAGGRRQSRPGAARTPDTGGRRSSLPAAARTPPVGGWPTGRSGVVRSRPRGPPREKTRALASQTTHASCCRPDGRHKGFGCGGRQRGSRPLGKGGKEGKGRGGK